MTSKKFGEMTRRLMPLFAVPDAEVVGAALDEDAGAVDAARQQCRRRQRDRRDAGHGREPVEHVAVERRRPLLVVAIQRRVDAEEQQVLRVESDVHVAQVAAACGETGPRRPAAPARWRPARRAATCRAGCASPTTPRLVSLSAEFTFIPVPRSAGAMPKISPGQAGDGQHEQRGRANRATSAAPGGPGSSCLPQ